MRIHVALILLAVGMAYAESPKDSAVGGATAISNGVVFVKADGWKLTENTVSNIVMVQARMRELARKPVKPDMFPFWANRAASKAMHGMLYTHLMVKEFVRRGIKRTIESDAEILARYNRLTRQKAGSEKELAANFGSLEGCFHEQFNNDSLLEAGFRGLPECAVTDADVAARYQLLSNRMVRVKRINQKAYAKAQKAYGRLKAGEAWDIVATNTTEDALLEATYSDNWKEWGTFKLAQIEPEDLMAAVVTMKSGEFTRPIETEEGIVIVRLCGKSDDCYTLGRILFRMGSQVEIPKSDQIRKQLVQEKRNEYQDETLPSLRGQANIEYPLGTNFVYKIWKEPEATTAGRSGIPIPRGFRRRK